MLRSHAMQCRRFILALVVLVAVTALEPRARAQQPALPDILSLPYLFARMVRVIELPRTATIFLHPANQPRFEFKKGGQRTIDGVKTVEVKFQERTRPTIIRGGGDRDAPSQGSFWIDPATGHALMSVLKNGDSSTLHDELTMTYREAPGLGLFLPAQLVEKVTDDDAGLKVDAKAAFTKWRAISRARRD